MFAQLGIIPTREEMLLHLDIGVGWRFMPEIERVILTERWLRKLEAANCSKKIFPVKSSKQVLAERWFLVTVAAVAHGLKIWTIYHRSELSRWSNRRFLSLAKLFMLCVKRGR
jgi:hypothetical protein